MTEKEYKAVEQQVRIQRARMDLADIVNGTEGCAIEAHEPLLRQVISELRRYEGDLSSFISIRRSRLKPEKI